MAENYYPSKSDKRDPRPGMNYSAKVDVRLDKELDSMLDRLSNRNEVSRSDIMRRALKDFYKFNFDEDGEE